MALWGYGGSTPHNRREPPQDLVLLRTAGISEGSAATAAWLDRRNRRITNVFSALSARRFGWSAAVRTTAAVIFPHLIVNHFRFLRQK
jgi:hypothetical protein